VDTDRAAALQRLEETVSSGKALQMFARMTEAQGGDPRVVSDYSLLPKAPVTMEYRAVLDGVVADVPPRKIGHTIIALGGGRSRTEDSIDPAVGLMIPAKPGQRVRRGDVLAVIHARTQAGAERAREALDEAIVIGTGAKPLPLVSHRVTAQGVEHLSPHSPTA
jgi:pyrimidine-nucleoside phosphorylase